MTKPIIALSLGDPAGIGPELVAELSYDDSVLREARVVCFGDEEALLAGYAAKQLVPRYTLDAPKEGLMSLVAVTHLPKGSMRFGQKNPGAGRAQLAYFDAAIDAVSQNKADAICTAPITKAIVDEEAGPFSGHTGHLAKRAGGRAVMMLASEALRVILVTEHLPLKEVASKLSIQGLSEVIQITAHGLQRDFGIARPRLSVAALNPHAGEGGLLGREEIEIITPAVIEARRALRDSCEVLDPAPADSLFTASARARYDAAICLYHDQGLIPLKALSARSAVNVTLGLSMVRTSPDHGTAYDIAGKGIADVSSLRRSVQMAAEVVRRRRSS